jgi:PAS domain-containing protein
MVKEQSPFGVANYNYKDLGPSLNHHVVYESIDHLVKRSISLDQMITGEFHEESEPSILDGSFSSSYGHEPSLFQTRNDPRGFLINHQKDPILTEDEWLMLCDGDPDSTVMVISIAGIISFVSENCEHLVGFSMKEILQTDLRSFIHPDDYNPMTVEIGYCVQNRKTDFTSVVRCVTSHQYYILVDIKGRICATERHIAEEKVKEPYSKIDQQLFFVLVFRDYGKVNIPHFWDRVSGGHLNHLGQRILSTTTTLKPHEDPSLNCIAEQRQGLFTAYLSVDSLVFFHVSPLCSSYIGYSPLEICRQNLHSFVHQNEAPSLREFSQMIRHRSTTADISQSECIMRFRVKDGFYIWLVFRLSSYNGYRTQMFIVRKEMVRLFEFRRLNGPPTEILRTENHPILTNMSFPKVIPVRGRSQILVMKSHNNFIPDIHE